MTSLLQVVTEEGFPHGVRCEVCHDLIAYGSLYDSRMESMSGGGDPVETIRCLGCSYSKHAYSLSTREVGPHGGDPVDGH